MIEIEYKSGSILLSKKHSSIETLLTWDPRIEAYRCGAIHYRNIIETLRRHKIAHNDKAKQFTSINISSQSLQPLRTYQQRALDNWALEKRGVVVLPTGAGKTTLAVHIILLIKRSTLVVVPTIDLMNQWYDTLADNFKIDIGLIGGGSYELKDLTIITYDSAALKMDILGDQYGLIIFDECHHLPSERNQLAAKLSIAPYRLGLTATPEREYGEFLYDELIGPLVYREEIKELRGKVLSPYEVKRIEVELTSEERSDYDKYRKLYLDFVRKHKIDFSSPYGWSQFLSACGRMRGGRDVFNAYLLQKRIAAHAKNKFYAIWNILQSHLGERTIIFTSENHTAYEIGRTFFLPVITYQTKLKERRDFLAHFKAGEYNTLVTSKVLNEGVDIPEASIGIIASGSSSVREHVQRLGRILRRAQGKEAILYELVSSGTSERSISYRRSRHSAYQRSN